jgi:hypothetical protein
MAFMAFNCRAGGVFIAFMGLCVDISVLEALFFVVRDELMREGNTSDVAGFY